MLKKYLDFVYKYKEFKPNFEVIKLSQKQNSFQFVGGQIANNKLYSIVNSSEKMLRYNLKTKEMQFLGEFSKTDFKWTGGCVYENMMINLKPTNKKLRRRMIGIVTEILGCTDEKAENLLEENGWNIRSAVE